MKLLTVTLLIPFFPLAKAIPALDVSVIDNNPLGQPFVNAVLPVQPSFSPRFSLFRRQGCPNLSLLCPSGVCCSYADSTTCCGNTCCPLGYICSGGTPSAPCCVAIGAVSNTCGGSNGNPCARPGDILCNGINICCPPNNSCYYDISGIARCSPLFSSITSTTSSTTTSFSSTPTTTTSFLTPTTTTPFQTPTTPTPISHSSTSKPTPIPTPVPQPIPPLPNTSFWTPAAIGGVSGGAAGFVIVAVFAVWCCCRPCRKPTPRKRNTYLGNTYGRDEKYPRNYVRDTTLYDKIQEQRRLALLDLAAKRQETRRIAVIEREKRLQAKLKKMAIRGGFSILRHAILHWAVPFLGSAVCVAWDAWDAADVSDIVSHISNLDDMISGLDNLPDADTINMIRGNIDTSYTDMYNQYQNTPIPGVEIGHHHDILFGMDDGSGPGGTLITDSRVKIISDGTNYLDPLNQIVSPTLVNPTPPGK